MSRPSRPSQTAATSPESGAATPRGLVHVLGMAGSARNVGFAANKVFAAAMLESFHASQPVIGFVLALEGLFGLVLNPLTGWMSDHARRPGWRRKAYVLICLPAAALLWLVFAYAHSFVLAAAALTLFYVFQQSCASPYHAWMPDVVPRDRWGVASGYLNLWWQLGNLLSFLVIPLVWTASHTAGFWMTALLMAVGGVWTGLGVPERAIPHPKTVAKGPGPTARAAVAPEATPGDRCAGSAAEASPAPGGHPYRQLLRGNLLLYFIAQAFAWLAFEAIASFFTLFVTHVAHGTLLQSALAMSVFTATGMLAAVWAGRWYRRWMPQRLIAVVMTLFGLLALCGLVVHTMVWVFIIVAIEGVFWSANLTVAYALATDLLRAEAGEDLAARMRGRLYGFGNFVQSIGLMVAAPVAGLVIRAAGGNYAGMFLVSCLAALMCALLALCIRTRVHVPAATERAAGSQA
ncbi:MFS transporter [Alicyclobacillus macrosporangiidus]|uniref:Na+/melibiose symporter n=1 Tax=Alicyclobacillus macrosporangiidus TaxID=392015 RepID=A0A1I7F3C8_9BACL|nr:MFS transporter [Alicyclobacillus macrosporangiidus]SFU30656.1 Na+/melibiose symporter [Alicyclobacillus macrosporangiidus]